MCTDETNVEETQLQASPFPFVQITLQLVFIALLAYAIGHPPCNSTLSMPLWLESHCVARSFDGL